MSMNVSNELASVKGDKCESYPKVERERERVCTQNEEEGNM